MSDQQFEVPAAMREMLERNVEQVRSAYSQFMDIARQTQEMMTQSHGAVTASTLEIQSRAMSFAERNIEEGFKFAADLARVRDVEQYMKLQQAYTERQIANYTKQAEDLGRLVTEAAQKAQPKT